MTLNTGPLTGLGRSMASFCRPVIAAASLSALIAAAAGLSTSLPVAAQSLDQPDSDRSDDYGDDLEPFKTEGPLVAIISLGSQTIRVFDRNGLVVSSRVSTGKRGHETPEGIFSIIERKVEHNSNLYDDAEMPFMQRITWSGVALHEGFVPRYRASHGCIRLPKGFAERLFRTTRLGTRVIIVPHDATLEPVTHPVLPQPGTPPAEPVPPTTAPGNADMIDIAATPSDTSRQPEPAVASAADTAAAAKSTPGLAELRARRAVLEKMLQDATRTIDQAKLLVRPRLVEQGKAQRALRVANALANRAQGRAEVLEAAIDKMAIGAEQEAAIIDHLEALLEVAQTRGAVADASEMVAQKKATADAVLNHVKRLVGKRQQIVNESRAIARKLMPITIFVSREAGRVFVHQATHPIMDLPIEIRDPDRPLGTHIFTAQAVEGDPDAVRWVGLTLETPSGRAPVTRSRKGRDHSAASKNRDPLIDARAALDRFVLPHAVLARVMPTLQPGSTVIVSDLGKSIENGPGTDIIVQTKGEAAAARSIANFMSRKRAASWDDDDAPYRSRRRAHSGGWVPW